MSGRLVLAVESSAARGAVAVLSPEAPIAAVLAEAEFERGAGGRGGGSPAAAAGRALLAAGRRPGEVGLVAVSVGPGSYTGLRIGVSFGKTFAWATGAALVPVPSLAALAETARASSLAPGILVATADAFRGQLYARVFRPEPCGGLASLTGDLVLTPEALVSRLAELAAAGPGGSGVPLLFGSGADRSAAGLTAAAGRLGLSLALAAGPLSPDAGAVGRLGIRLAASGMTVTAHDLVPVYLRKTEAEERLEARAQREPSGT